MDETFVENLADKMEEALDGVNYPVAIAAIEGLAAKVALNGAEGDKARALEILDTLNKSAIAGITGVDPDLH
jgi:hypothetical protein